MLTTDPNGRQMLGADHVAELLVRPLQNESIAAQVSTIDTLTGEGRHSMLFPVLETDPAVAWIAEGEEIPIGNPTFNQIEVTPSKTGGLFICSNELLHDSQPEATNEVGRGLLRQVVNSVDAAYFGPRPSAEAPGGLNELQGVTEIDGTAGNVDWAEEATMTTLTREGFHFVAHPTDALAIARIKESAGSQRNLLQVDPTQPTVRMLAGVPLLTSAHVIPGTVWGIPPHASRFVLREDASVIASSEAFFSSDKTALRALMRVGFGFPAPSDIIKVLLEPADDDGE